MPAVDLVVDVGNTRIKWGRCSAGRVEESVALPHDHPEAWRQQLAAWGLQEQHLTWALTGVVPRQCDHLAAWARERGDQVQILEAWEQLPLRVLLEHPEWVGIDRLLDAVAANSRRPAQTPAVVIDAGSAVTVDWLDADGAFVGGAILPGFRLMAQALHEHTALLPLIEVPPTAPPLPGASTPGAMRVGIFWSVAGGIQALVEQMARQAGQQPHVFLTGGDGPLLHPVLGAPVELWPGMTLEGIRLTVAAARPAGGERTVGG